MHWRFFTEERIEVSTTALQEPCRVSKFSIAMLMPDAPQPPGCPQQHWDWKNWGAPTFLPVICLGGHGNLLGNLQQTVSSHLMVCDHIWDGTSHQLQCTFYKSEQPIAHYYFWSYLGRFKVWSYYNFEVSLIPDMLHGTWLLPEISFGPQIKINFWRQYIKHIFSFNTFVKYVARKSEFTLT